MKSADMRKNPSFAIPWTDNNLFAPAEQHANIKGLFVPSQFFCRDGVFTYPRKVRISYGRIATIMRT